MAVHHHFHFHGQSGEDRHAAETLRLVHLLLERIQPMADKIDDLKTAVDALVTTCSQSLDKISQLLAVGGVNPASDPRVQALLDEVNGEVATMQTALAAANPPAV